MGSGKFAGFEPTGFVYFARIPRSDWYKIGESRSPEMRIRQLGAPCELVHTVKTFHRASVEKNLLDLLSDYLSEGREWFELPEQLAKDVPRMMEEAKFEQPSLSKQLPLNFGNTDTYTPHEIAAALQEDFPGSMKRHLDRVRKAIQTRELDAYDIDEEVIISPPDLEVWLGREKYERLFLSREDETQN